ncbi:MAG TPA: acetylxylan esterase, partial [Planctomycetota bacterium]|nr:acetylxylan esterase [Planctomycetota bacterium]
MGFLILLWALQDADLADRLREAESRVLPEPNPRMIGRDSAERLREANRRETDSWHRIQSRADWEAYRDRRIDALRQSLGAPEAAPKDLKVRVTRTLQGPGHTVENLVLESRPGLLVTANLYVPDPPRPSMPGILIIHSHHNPKTQGELQDMGVTWARSGCLVLVMDQLGHGERRQHPFVDATSYPTPYRVSRQDYFHRYMTALQLHVAGESLVGWMAWDQMRGVDLLLARPGIDRERIMILGSVAGGGDPAAVTAAIDPRIAAAVPFNFGGPQPETTFPLPADPEAAFNYAGGGSWESTRNLRLSARDGFLPWVIVGSLAPRRLIYGHEFAWDQEHDPVWKRLEKIFSFYERPGDLAWTKGRGSVKGQPPEASHCNNIGPVQRTGIHEAFGRWFGLPVPEKDVWEHRSASELACLLPDQRPRSLHELLKDRTGGFSREGWAALLGGVDPSAVVKVKALDPLQTGGVAVERVALEVDAGIVVPAVVLVPPRAGNPRLPVVVGVAQGGKGEFLRKRSSEIAAFLRGGAIVCLPDLRGTGETRPGSGRGRQSEATDISATELMLGRTLVGLRVRDLRSVLRYLRGRADVDPKRLALWGDSFSDPNPPDRPFAVPLELDDAPRLGEPLGGLVTLLGALFEDEVVAVHVRGGLSSYRSILESPFVYIPHDAIVPGALLVGDLEG